MDILAKARHIHFVGIGGIGISAIARMMLAEGRTVTGSDTHASHVTDELNKLGAIITFDQSTTTIPSDTELIIYTAAIPVADVPFFEAMKAGNVPSLSYPEALREVTKEKFTIAVAGTHGKTTTTAMIAKVMIDAGLDPTVIVGSLMINNPSTGSGQGSNFIAGKSKYFVIEADEYRRAFLNYWPNILAITNIGVDHLDYYKDFEEIKNTFAEFASHVPADGVVVVPARDMNLAPVLETSKGKVVDWELMPPPAKLLLPGRHNMANAQVALAVAEVLGIAREAAEASLANFQGTWRRFEYKGETKEGSAVYDDYAHNPDKVRAALQGTREKYPDHKIIAVFQPHLYSRTKQLLVQFAEAFKDADEVFLVPIYAAREASDPTISAEILAEELRKRHERVFVFPDFAAVETYLHTILTPECVVMIMGAGSITELASKLVVEK